MTALTVANVIELLNIYDFIYSLRLSNIRVLKYILKGKMELSKEDARAIWLQKDYYRYRFEYNHIVYEQPSLKLSNIKNQLLFQKSSTNWMASIKEEYDYLLIRQVLTGIFFFKEYWSLRFEIKL